MFFLKTYFQINSNKVKLTGGRFLDSLPAAFVCLFPFLALFKHIQRKDWMRNGVMGKSTFKDRHDKRNQNSIKMKMKSPFFFWCFFSIGRLGLREQETRSARAKKQKRATQKRIAIKQAIREWAVRGRSQSQWEVTGCSGTDFLQMRSKERRTTNKGENACFIFSRSSSWHLLWLIIKTMTLYEIPFLPSTKRQSGESGEEA